MKLRHIRSNMTVCETDKANVLFSYNTPVAADIHGEGLYITEKKHSQTTTRHVNQWIQGKLVSGTKPQEFFDNLI